MTLADLKAQEKAAKKAEKERQKRIDADEKAERKRAAKTGFSNPANPTRSMALTIVCAIFAVYCLFPFVYLMINATKTQSDFTSTFGLGFGKTFALFDNIATVFTYQTVSSAAGSSTRFCMWWSAPAVPPCWPSWAAMRWPSSASPAVSCAS